MIYDNNKESDGDSNLVKIFAAELFSWIQENKQILDNNPALKKQGQRICKFEFRDRGTVLLLF